MDSIESGRSFTSKENGANPRNSKVKPWKRILAATALSASFALGHVPHSEAQRANSSPSITSVNNLEQVPNLPFQILLSRLEKFINPSHEPTNAHALNNNMLKTAVFQEGTLLRFIQEAENGTFNNSEFNIQVPSGYYASEIFQVNSDFTLVTGKKNKRDESLLINNQTNAARIINGSAYSIDGKVFIQDDKGLSRLNLIDYHLEQKMIEGKIRIIGSNSDEKSISIYGIQNNRLIEITEDQGGNISIQYLEDHVIDSNISNGGIISLVSDTQEPYAIKITDPNKNQHNVSFRLLETKASQMIDNHKEIPSLLKLDQAPVWLNNNAVGAGIMGNDVVLYALSAENEFQYPQMTQITCPLKDMQDYNIVDAKIEQINDSNVATLSVTYKENKSNHLRVISYAIYAEQYGALAVAPLVLPK